VASAKFVLDATTLGKGWRLMSGAGKMENIHERSGRAGGDMAQGARRHPRFSDGVFRRRLRDRAVDRERDGASAICVRK